MSKKESVSILREMLGEMFDKMYRGAGIETHSLAQGLADGYMRALVDMSVVNDAELFKVIQEERRNAAYKADQTLYPVTGEEQSLSEIDAEELISTPHSRTNYA